MIPDPIVEGIHAIRREILHEHGGDLRAVVRELQRQEQVERQRGRRFVSFPPRRTTDSLTDEAPEPARGK